MDKKAIQVVVLERPGVVRVAQKVDGKIKVGKDKRSIYADHLSLGGEKYEFRLVVPEKVSPAQGKGYSRVEKLVEQHPGEAEIADSVIEAQKVEGAMIIMSKKK